MIFTIALIQTYLGFYDYFQSKEVSQIPIQVLITLLGAGLAGVFTIIGVDRTLQKQNKTVFISEFPNKIYLLDELIEGLSELNEKISVKNAPFLDLERNAIKGLYDYGTGIDGFVYFELRRANDKFSLIVDDLNSNCFERDPRRINASFC
jgi:hypothetical protein